MFFNYGLSNQMAMFVFKGKVSTIFSSARVTTCFQSLSIPQICLVDYNGYQNIFEQE